MGNLTPPTSIKKNKTAKADGDDAPKKKRSKFAEMWPEDTKLECLVDENPKRGKSKDRFEHYFTSKTVGDFLAKGGTYADIAYDLGRNRIKVG